MLFPDYEETNILYHIAPITDLGNILEEGIKYDDKTTYLAKYLGFHKFIDSQRLENIPRWVIRQQAIFASMNFADDHSWHSHSVILGVKIKPEMCWVANENLANEIYEPFVLKDIEEFKYLKEYINTKGKEKIKEYWKTSLSFLDNIKVRRDKYKDYDGEVLILHDIPPKDITLIAIVCDHRIITIDQWKKYIGNR